jgi:tRNA nucleotidyltransferase/poly(A) polymerase
MPFETENERLSIAGAEWFQAASLQAVFRALNREGFEARAVGGAVRNALMGRPVSDVDLATTAPPHEVMRLAAAADLKTVPTGLEHGTVTVISDGVPYEVTTLRRDVETDGRRAVVAFGTDWTRDASRRDFTMNALYADAGGRVYDPLGTGLADIAVQCVRFIGDACDRIREDYLRILRFFRFSAEYGTGALDPAGLSASIRCRAGLRQLSRERVRAELLQILTARGAVHVVEVMEDAGLLQPVLAGVTLRARFQRLVGLEQALGRAPDAMLRLGALAVRLPEDVDRLVTRLRLSNAERQELEPLADLPGFEAGLQRLGADFMLYRRGQRDFINALLLIWAAAGAPPADADWRVRYSAAQDWRMPRFPLNGRDLLAEGVNPGPELGQRLKELEQDWAVEGFRLSRAELLDRLRKTAGRRVGTSR